MGHGIRGRWIQSGEEDRYYKGQVQDQELIKIRNLQGQGQIKGLERNIKMQAVVKIRSTRWVKERCSWIRVPRTIERKKTLRQGAVCIGHKEPHSRIKTINPEKDR